MDYHIRLATMEDVMWLAERLREADRAEIAAASGLSPAVSLARGLAYSKPCLVGLSGETPVVTFGIIPVSSETGSIWLLATDDIDTHAREYLRRARPWLDAQQLIYKNLVCIADARNTKHQRLIKWAGFKQVERIEHYGVERRPFIKYERHSNV